MISNLVTKTKPFEARFGRPPNTKLSIILVKTNKTRLLYNKIPSFDSDEAKQKQPVLPRDSMWQMKNSEPELDIRYKDEEAPKEDRHPVPSQETWDSENAPFQS